MLKGIASGKYSVKFYDTVSGKVVRQTTTAVEDELRVALPPVEKDIAVKIRMQD